MNHFGTMHLLRTLLSKMTDMLADECENLATLPQYVVLTALANSNKPLNQTDLVKLTHIDRSTMGDIIRRLRHRELIRRNRSAADARCQNVRITDKGAEVVAKMAPILERIDQKFLGHLSERDRIAFKGSLAALAGVEPEEPQAKAA